VPWKIRLSPQEAKIVLTNADRNSRKILRLDAKLSFVMHKVGYTGALFYSTCDMKTFLRLDKLLPIFQYIGLSFGKKPLISTVLYLIIL
jgi:hypothetical protein